MLGWDEAGKATVATTPRDDRSRVGVSRGLLLFLRVLRERRWNVVRTGFLPVALFASLLGVATIVHWDKFNHHHVAFWLWAALYFTTPFIVLAAC